MGYYSDVYIAVKKKDYIDLLERINSDKFKFIINDEEKCENIRNLINHAKITEKCFSNPEYIEMYLEHIKWFVSFVEVDFINKWLEEIEDYDIVTIGDEFDDVRIISGSEECLYSVSRNIIRY